MNLKTAPRNVLALHRDWINERIYIINIDGEKNAGISARFFFILSEIHFVLGFTPRDH